MLARGRIRPLLLFILVLWLPIAGLLLDRMSGCSLQKEIIGPAAAPNSQPEIPDTAQ